MPKTTKGGTIDGVYYPAGSELTNDQMFSWAPEVGSEPGRAVEPTTPPPAEPSTPTPTETTTSANFTPAKEGEPISKEEFGGSNNWAVNGINKEFYKRYGRYPTKNEIQEIMDKGQIQELGAKDWLNNANFMGQEESTAPSGDIRGTLLGPSEFNNVINNFREAGLTDEEIERDVINRVPNTLTGVTDIFLKQGVTQDQAFVDSVVAKREEGDIAGSGGDVGSNVSGDLEDQQEQQQQQQTVQNIDNLLANSGLPQDQQDLIKTVVDSYPENTDISDEQILETFESLSKQIIDPHFASLVKQTQADLTVAIDRTRQDREFEREQELVDAQERFRQGQLALEGTGMTRSGEGVRQLGEQSGARGATGEGNIQRYSRRLAESSGRAFDRSIHDLGREGESLLGSEGVGDIEGFSPVGDVVGSIPQAKLTTQANLLGQLSGQQGSLEDFQRQFI